MTVADWLILQVPFAAVFEGEPLVLRCRGWYDKAVYKLHYYRDGRAVRFFASSANYTVPQARAGDSGRYQCSGTMRIPVESAPMFSAKVAVTVQGGRALGSCGSGTGRGKEGRVSLPDRLCPLLSCSAARAHLTCSLRGAGAGVSLLPPLRFLL